MLDPGDIIRQECEIAAQRCRDKLEASEKELYEFTQANTCQSSSQIYAVEVAMIEIRVAEARETLIMTERVNRVFQSQYKYVDATN